jgi:hypothetical protein
MQNEYGNLTVRAYTAGGGLPVEGAVVRIRGAEELNRDIYYELITDESGNTKIVSLPAPSEAYSLTPNNTPLPYSLYELEIEKQGYYDKRINGVTVFSNVNSLQLVNMIPLSEGGEGEYPRGSLNTDIPDNNSL